MTGNFDLWLVGMSVVVACGASYVALELVSRVVAARSRQSGYIWLLGGAVSIGTGIWSMHFIGMLAWQLPMPMSYDVSTILASMLTAVVVCGFGLYIVSHGQLHWRRLGLAGLLMGSGISAVHYVGMEAMQMQPPIRYQSDLFALSLIVAVAASLVALWLAFRLRGESIQSAFWRRGGSALVMGGAIAGMHYVGVTAVIIAPGASSMVPDQGVNNLWLAGTIGCFALLFLAVTLLMSSLDAQSARRAVRHADQLHTSEAQYRLLWETTSDAALLFDSSGRIESANSTLMNVFGYEPAEVIGQNISLLQPAAMRGRYAITAKRYLDDEASTNGNTARFLGLHRDGHEFPVEVAFSRFDLEGRLHLAAFVRDISAREHAQSMIAGHKQLLEQIVAGQPLFATLDAIIALLDGQFPASRASILLLDNSSTSFVRQTNLSLSTEQDNALIALETGTVMVPPYADDVVVIRDIEADPKWAPCRHLSLPLSARTCWSHAIVSQDGNALGTLALYSGEFRDPNVFELDSLRALAPLVAIAVERAQSELQMRAMNERFELVARATHDAVCDWNPLTSSMWWNDAYTTLFGHTLGANPTFESWTNYLHPEEREGVLASVQAALDSDTENWVEEYRLRRRDGSYASVMGRAIISRDVNGRAVRMVGSIMDITSRKLAEEQLVHLAQYDGLTGLPNRSLYRDRLSRALVRADRENWPVALAFIDLDHFKEINDTLGHDVGDGVLRTVADRLRASVRKSDTVARLGGDEFTVVLENVGTDEEIAQLAQKVIENVSAPIALDGHELFVTASVGIVLYPEHGNTSETLSQNADTAMYQAKSEGRNNYKFYAPSMSAAASERMDLESELRLALLRGEFKLYYQPLVSFETGTIRGVEALLRWQHPQWGLTAPGRFINVAEHSGLIVPIGEWVLNEACAQAVAWRADGLPPIQMSVNISPRQLRYVDLIATLNS